MGNVFDKIMHRISNNSPKNILMLGLENAGKTTIIYRMKNIEDFNTVPTVGLTVETLSPCRGVTLTVWDVGGQDKLRSLWHHYLQNLDGLVFVIDSTDHQRIALAKAELIGIYQHDSMKNVPLVVMVNKQDHPDALSAEVVADQLDLKKWAHSSYQVVACCALNGDGITEGFIKLAKLIRKKSKIVRSESF